MEVRHQRQGGHLKVTFQSTQQMLPISRLYLLSSFYIPISSSLRPSLPPALFLFWLSFAFLLFLTPPPPPPTTSPSFHQPPLCDVLTRQQAGSSVIKGSANERLSGVNVLTYLCRTRGERSFIPRGQTVSLFDWGVSKVQKVTIKDTRS